MCSRVALILAIVVVVQSFTRAYIPLGEEEHAHLAAHFEADAAHVLLLAVRQLGVVDAAADASWQVSTRIAIGRSIT